MKTANREVPHYGVLFTLFLLSISYFRTRLVSMSVIGYGSCFVTYFVRLRFLTEVSNAVVVSKLVTTSILINSSVSNKTAALSEGYLHTTIHPVICF